MATAAELGVEITGDPTGLQRALEETRRMLDKLKESVAAASKSSTSSFNQITDAISVISPTTGRVLTSAAANFKAFGLEATLATAGIAGAVGVIGKAAFDAAIEFDTAFDKIRVATGATDERLKALEGSFRTLFTSLPTTSEAVSEALSFLNVRLGLTGKELENLAKQELELARITGAALGPQLEATTKLFNRWQISTEDQSKALDFLFKVSQQTAVSVTDLSRTLVQVSAPLQELGFSFEQAAILVGKLTAEGINVSQMSMGLKKALADMAKEGVTDAATAFEALITKIKDTQNPMEQLAIATKLFGQKAGEELVQAIRAGRFEIEEMQKKVGESQETINKAAEATNDYAESWKTLRNKVTEELEPLGKTIFDGLTAIVNTFTGKQEEIKASWSRLWADLTGQTNSGSNALVNLLNSSFNSISNAAKAVAQVLYDAITGPLQRALDWIKGKAAAFEAAFSAITAAARTGLVIKSPPIAAQWVMMIGEAAAASAEKVKNSAPVFAAGFASITDAAESAKTAAFFIEDAVQQINELAKSMESAKAPTIAFVDGFQDVAEAQKKVADAAKDLIPAEKELADVMEAGAKMIGNTEPYVRVTGAAQVLQSKFDELSRQLPRAWNTIIDALTGGASKASVKIKGFASDLINVFQDMPGKWGQAFNRTISEINQWINFIDSIVKLVQRLLGSDSPTGLGGILSGLSGVFKKTTQDIKTETEDWAGTLENMSNGVTTEMSKAATGVESGAGRIVGAFTQIAAAALAFIGAKGQGFVGGALSGALGGIAAAGGIAQALGVALSPLTLGLSALGGALLGGIIGLFGGGKSAAQKQQEALQLEQLKANVQKSAQDVINAAIQGFDAALAFFDKLDEFTAPRKRKFAQFWTAMTRLMNGFLELAKLWSADAMAQAKAAAESIRPIADAISALPDAFNAISGHFGVAQAAIDRFFLDFDRVIEAFFARADEWIDGVSKRAKKVAQRLLPAVELITNFGAALTSVTDIKEPTDEFFAIFDRTIDKILTHVTELSLKYEKDVLKAMANFADKTGAALGIWTQAIESIKATVDVPLVSATAVDNVVAGIELFISKLASVADRLIDVDLQRAATLANSILPIAEAIKSWAETAEVVRGYAAIAAEVWDSILADFERGLILLNLLIGDAQIYLDKAKTFSDLINQGADIFSGALARYVASVQQVSSTMMGLPQGGVPIGGPGTPTTSAALGAAAPVTLQLVLQPGDPRTEQILAFIRSIFGDGALEGSASQFA